MEELWKVANCFYKENSDEATAWVRERVLRILRGEVSQVVKGMRKSATDRGLTGAKRKTVDGVAAYYLRNRHRMRYHEYLRDGLPIASGSVEGACENLVKDRMERSGMRWTIPTAEAVLKLRATYLSGDMQEYWSFHLQKERERLYPEVRSRAGAKHAHAHSPASDEALVARVRGRRLLAEARAARARAYAPYSGFAVGAAVRGASGRIYRGANVENVSYGLTICAERAAVFAAVLAGEKSLASCAVVATTPGPPWPCGACRQVLREFASEDATIVLESARSGAHVERRLGGLLPDAFLASDLTPPS